MQKNTDRILTTHVGSLPRPQPLLDMLRARQEHKPFGMEDFDRLLRDSVRDIVQQQAKTGIDIVSDGEFSKTSFQNYARERLSGFGPLRTPLQNPRVKSLERRDFPEFYAETEGSLGTGQFTIGCVGPVSYTGAAILQADLANLRSAMGAASVAQAFVPAISPGNFGSGENEYYASDDEFMAALASALSEEYRAIVDAGFLLQIDAPVGTAERFGMTSAEFRRYFGRSIELLNAALADVPAERVRFHVCWGSWNGPHTHDIPLIELVDLVLQVKAAGLSIEAANPRHEHEFQVWQEVKLPEDKVLIPGMISHATNIVEHPDLIAWRIKNFARAVGRENVVAGADCGFAQSAFTRRVHPTIMWAKFQALSEGARIASTDLWRG